jgi:hypothetical protein
VNYIGRAWALAGQNSAVFCKFFCYFHIPSLTENLEEVESFAIILKFSPTRTNQDICIHEYHCDSICATAYVLIEEHSEIRESQLIAIRDHLRDHHRPAQCTRCWDILDDEVALDFHKDRLEPRCPDLSSVFELREGIDKNKWDPVEKALRTPKLKKQNNMNRKSDFEKWMDVWEILFPANLYPNLPRPEHPCRCMTSNFIVLFSHWN